MPNAKPVLCLDFDGVIHSYSSGWKGGCNVPDPPVPGAIDFIVAAQKHFNIAIHSSRFRHDGGMGAVEDWLVEHGIERLYLTREVDFARWENGAILLSAEKPPAFLTLDDRAVTFDGTFPAPESLLAFRPWNKKGV